MLSIFELIPPQITGVCFVAGFLLIAHAHNRKHYISKLLKHGHKTEGKVIELYRNPGSLFSKKEGEGFAPVVEYVTQSGNTLKHYSSTYKAVSNYQVGQVVPIWYINYKSKREAALADDQVGSLPRNLFRLGALFLLLSLPRLVFGLLGLVLRNVIQ
jgi:hypothetical protein